MRSAKAFLASAALAIILRGQQPIAVGADRSGGSGAGVVKFFDWYPATPSSCSDGASGFCVGHRPQGDTYYWTAWLPNANGLPVTSGLPVVGTINDYSLGSVCSGNIALLQLDKWNWATPTASHITKVNCMTSFGTSPGASNAPSGWNGHLTSTDSVGNAGTWKSRVPFSKGGILYLPVERQISQGGASVHDATFIMSPDSGAHWCNPYTWASRAGGPGCDSSNWQSDGDAPKCDAQDSSHPCTNAGYLDPSHSSIMWKGMVLGSENWSWINYANQDGQPPPAGVEDGCDPAAYTCFMLIPGDGALARVPNTSSILDISAWQYYTCPTITQSYRCHGTDPANWTANFANRTSVAYLSYTGFTFNGDAATNGRFINPYSIIYLKEFGSYLMASQGTGFAWAPAIQGPWTTIYWPRDSRVVGNFFTPSPALGYTGSSNPPSVQLTTNSNSYSGGQGSPNFALWELAPGRSVAGEAFQAANVNAYLQGAGYQFSSGNIAGSFPRKGLVWSFDFLDQGRPAITNWPYFVDRANFSAVVVPCEGAYNTPSNCGFIHNAHGTAMSLQGIQTNDTGENYTAHFQVSPADSYRIAPQMPSAMLGNGSYTVVGVYRLNGITGFHRLGGIWSAGTATNADNTLVALDQTDGKLVLGWNSPFFPHYQYISNFTFKLGAWHFVAVTVQAQGGACGTNCTPSAHIWVGGAITPGILADALEGVSYSNTPSHNAATRTPNVTSGPFVIGMNSATGMGYQSSMSYASFMVYDRPLSYPELQMMYSSFKTKLKVRGVTLQ